MYAHVATEADRPGKLALQYWLFYAYNDWNNLHEGDWEMIQLVFDAKDAKEALGEQPVEIGYSQHEGAERAGLGRRQARSGSAYAPGRLSRPPARTRTSSTSRCTSAARPSRASAATTRAGRTST